MTNKHTPAPWYYSEPDDFGDFNIISEKESLAVAVVTNGRMRELCGNADEQNANARLISAAPDLLEALKDMLPFVINTCKHNIESRELWPQFVDKAEAARAKAEGKCR